MKYKCFRCEKFFDYDDFMIEAGVCFDCGMIILSEVFSVKSH